MSEIGVNFLRRLLKTSFVLFLVSHGYSAAFAEETEPLLLVRTGYHVLLAWLAVTAMRARQASFQ